MSSKLRGMNSLFNRNIISKNLKFFTQTFSTMFLLANCYAVILHTIYYFIKSQISRSDSQPQPGHQPTDSFIAAKPMAKRPYISQYNKN